MTGSEKALRNWQGSLSALPGGSSKENPAEWAAALGVSTDALALCHEADVVDLHVDSFIWTRTFGYDIAKEHSGGPLPGYFARQVDLPRLRRVGINSAVWVITTNPLRSAKGRIKALRQNVQRLRQCLDRTPGVAVVRNLKEYRDATAAGKHAAFLGVQGGNALDGSKDLAEDLAEGLLLRVTLVHLSNSQLGRTSAPSSPFSSGLTSRGSQLVEALNAHRVFVDLAHIHPKGFYAAANLHDPGLPLIVTHTGVSGVHSHWRNLDDQQLGKIADFNGTVGIMYHSQYLGDSLTNGRAATVFRHLRHVVETVGDAHASLGSDWDGAIVTPRDMATCIELPRLVQLMLDHGWERERVLAILGQNFLRCLADLRGN